MMMKRNRGRFTTILAVSGEKLPWSVVFLPTAAPLSPRCICRRQRSSIMPEALSECLGLFFAHTKNSKHRKSDTCCFGRGRRDRTLGTRFWRPMLYQLSYTPIIKKCLLWWTITDSNRGPTGYEPVALTN